MIGGGETLVTIVFRLINFGTLIAVGVYIYRTYIADVLRKQILEREFFQAELRAQACLFDEKRCMQMATNNNQKELFELLKQRMAAWSQAVQEQQKKGDAARAKRAVAVHEYARMRAQKIVEQRVLQEALPQALDEAARELEHYFASQEKQHIYVATALTSQKKGEA